MPTFPGEPQGFEFFRNSRGSEIGLQPQIKQKLPVIASIFRKHTNPAYTITITAGQEWHHGHGLMSLHHTGFAVDVRTNDLPGGASGLTAQLIADDLKGQLGPHYFVQNEKTRHHIHIQYSSGLRISNPGDFNVNRG